MGKDLERFGCCSVTLTAVKSLMVVEERARRHGATIVRPTVYWGLSSATWKDEH